MKKLKTAALDTNVLLMWLVGHTDISLLSTFKRVDTFDATDFQLLGQFLLQFSELITTPHVLAEVSNFVDQAPPYRRKQLTEELQRFTEKHLEHYSAAKGLVTQPEFALLGLTDTGLAALSERAVIVTTDYRLSGSIAKRGGHTMNFNHLRSLELLTNR